MRNNLKLQKILLTGGGTAGSVAPLLAIAEELKNSPNPVRLSAHDEALYQGGNFEFLWIGTKYGPEREMVEKENIKFKSIVGGKLRRYFSWCNFIDPIFIIVGCFQSFFIILNWRPNLVITAGSFISVPVVWVAWLLRVPALVHQQDVRPGLANKLMAPLAKVITVTFGQSLKDYGKKAVWTGNPIRREIRNLPPPWRGPVSAGKFSARGGSAFGGEIRELKKKWQLKDDLPVVLIIGGGTGAMAINQLVRQSLEELTKFCQVILISGKNKGGLTSNFEVKPPMNFQKFEFLNAEQMAQALKLADLAITRAGMSFLTELSYLGKPTIIIPLPDSHQQDNAAMFKDAAVVLNQKGLTEEIFINKVKNLLADKEQQQSLSKKIKTIIKTGAKENIVEIIKNILYL